MKTKPSKPYEGFPLFAHTSGRWAKKINYKTVYFAKWDDPYGALKEYRDLIGETEKNSRQPASENDSGVVKLVISAESKLGINDAINIHLAEEKKRVEAGELSIRTWLDREYTQTRIVKIFGNRPINDLLPEDWGRLREDFQSTCGPVGVKNLVSRTKTIFNWLTENRYCLAPVYGTRFQTPSRKVLRREARKIDKSFTAEEIRNLIAAADQPMRSMIYLGVNCGLGNSDCSFLEMKHIDFKKGWLNYPRLKTEIDRRAKLWPETVALIEEYLRIRPQFDSPFVYLTQYGNTFVQPESESSELVKQFTNLQKKIGIFRTGRGFYSLRRMTETVGGNCKDQIAVDHVMGHLDSSMGGVYRLSVDDSRLEAVANTIREWLKPGLIGVVDETRNYG